jgi:hypothetical protein
MTVIKLKNPSDYELQKLLEESDDSTNWMIRERIPYVDEPEFNDKVFEDNSEAREYIYITEFSGQVAATIVYMEVSGESFNEDIFEDSSFERTLLNVSKETRQIVEENKPSDMDIDEYIQSII